MLLLKRFPKFWFFLSLFLLFVFASCKQNEKLALPTDPEEPYLISAYHFKLYKKKLEGRKVALFGYLVDDENGYGLLVHSTKEESQQTDSFQRYKDKIIVTVNEDFLHDRVAPNSPFNCINQNVTIIGHVGVLQGYPDIGIDQLAEIRVTSETGTEQCYLAPNYIPNYREVKSVQILLNNLGYDAGVANGSIQSKTRLAVKLFQRDKKILETGIIDDQLILELSKTVASQKQNQK